MTRKNRFPKFLHEVTDRHMRRGISRRQFLKYTGALGMTMPMLHSLVRETLAQEGTPSSAAVAEATASERFSGETLNVAWEAGLQAQDPILFSGPLWEERTGVHINVVEAPAGTSLYSMQLQEHIAASGALDVLNVQPSWVPDYVFAGVVEPLDDFIAQYLNPADLDDLTDIYKGLGSFEGVTYGLFDDGDTLLLYYRTDLFAEHADAFGDALGYELAPPQNWKEFDEIAKYFTDNLGSDVYGAAFGGAANWNAPIFYLHFKSNGGQFFDPDSMEPLINGPEGVRTVMEMHHSNQFMPPGIEQLGQVDIFQTWLSGSYAMTWFWPPLGRWSAGYGAQTEQLSFVPESQVVGKTGYALFPGDITQMSGAFNLSVAADSPRKELAYLFIQWLNSPEISLQRVTLPYALRDPFRISHFQSEEYQNLWPEASQYLDTLQEAGQKASLDILMPGGQEYFDAVDRACSAVYAGTDPQEAMDTAANEYAGTTERLGLDQQKQSYANYLTLVGAYPSSNLVDAPSNLDME